MDQAEKASRILDSGVIAVIRSDQSEGLIQAAEALATGGIKALEFTLNTPEALRLITDGREQLPSDVLVGAGTVISKDDARMALDAGAEFIVMPGLNIEAVQTVREQGAVAIPGAFTPTEVIEAWQAGADFVKLFPASQGGPKYLRALRGPLSDIRLVPTGGVSAKNAGDYIIAGAVAVAVGGKLVDQHAIQAGDFHHLEGAARELVQVVQQAKTEMSP